MKEPLQKRPAFILKSMLWSLPLYMIAMLAFNWDDVYHRVTAGSNTYITSVSPELPAQAGRAIKASAKITKAGTGTLARLAALLQIIRGSSK